MKKTEIEENVGKALVAHSQWKVKLRHAVQIGKLPKPAKDIACDDQCGLGIWLTLAGRDDQLSSMQKFVAVQKAHTHFHIEAGRIAKLVETGNVENAGLELDGPGYMIATEMLKSALVKLRKYARS